MTERRRLLVLRTTAGLLLCSMVAVASDPAIRCKTSKMGIAGAYDLCLLRTIARATRAGVAPDLTRCTFTFETKWGQAENRVPGACPTNGDYFTIETQVNADVNAIIAALMPSTTTTTAAVNAAATRCKVDKMAAAGTYDGCLLSTIARATRTGAVADLTRCNATYGTKWQQAERRAAGACLTTGDQAAIATQVNADVNAIIAALMPSTTTTTTSVTTTTLGCGNYPGCGGACPAGESCWAKVGPGLAQTCACLPATSTPCGSTGGSAVASPTCGGACPPGETCSTSAFSESLLAQCGCIPSGQPACLSFSGPCGGRACPNGLSCGADLLLACGCH